MAEVESSSFCIGVIDTDRSAVIAGVVNVVRPRGHAWPPPSRSRITA